MAALRPQDSTVLHASCVAVDGQGLLILGSSGAGKSALAIMLMAFGARLVSDDRTVITLADDQPVAAAPDAISGRIEARGLGILAADPVVAVPVRLAVDLGIEERDRLPPVRHLDLLGQKVRLLHNPGTDHFPAALLQYLKGGEAE